MNIGDLGLTRLEKPLYEETEQVIEPYFKLWATQLRDWLRQASQAVNELETVKTALQKTTHAKLNLENFQSVFILSTTRTKFVEEDAQRVLTEGYKLLNNIGETFRNEQINYRITITSGGDKLLGATSTGGLSTTGSDVYTFTVPMEKFLKFVNATSWESSLKGADAIYKALQKSRYINKSGDLLKRAENIAMQKWDEQRKQKYLLFHDQAIHTVVMKGKEKTQPWLNVNQGNTLEAFFRFTEVGWDPHYEEDKNYWKEGIYAAMKATMSQPDIFVKGGDIANDQIKGINASVTNLGTLINVSQTLLQSLMLNKSVFNEISSSFKPSIKAGIEANATQTINQVTEALKGILLSSTNRDLNRVFKVEIDL